MVLTLAVIAPEAVLALIVGIAGTVVRADFAANSTVTGEPGITRRVLAAFTLIRAIRTHLAAAEADTGKEGDQQ